MPHPLLSRLLLIVTLVGGGCAHTPTLAPGKVDAPPSLSCLPEIRADSAADTRRAHQGLLMAKQAFGMPLAPPADHSYEALQAWAETAMLSWLTERNRALQDIELQFGLGTTGTETEQVVGRAVLGLLREDTAQTLRGIPVPQELQQEPEIAVMYQEIITSHAVPFQSAALIDFRTCANSAFDGPDATQHFATFCDGRFRLLREAVEAHQAQTLGSEVKLNPTETHMVTTDNAPPAPNADSSISQD